MLRAHGCHLKWGHIHLYVACSPICSTLNFYSGSYLYYYSSISTMFGVLSISFRVGHLGWGAFRRAPWEPLFIRLGIFECLKNNVDRIGKSREKRPGFNYRENASVVNAFIRVSTMLTKAPHLLNLDCNHYMNNNKALKEIVLYNRLEKDKWSSSFGSKGETRITCYRTCFSMLAHEIFGSSLHTKVEHWLLLKKCYLIAYN